MKTVHKVPILVMVLASLAVPPGLTAQACESRPSRAWLGVGTFSCDGGVCRVHGAIARSSDAPPDELWDSLSPSTTWPNFERGMPGYDFSVEPSLWNIHPDGPASGQLEDGDVLVAVNDRAVTSAQASRELEEMEPGEPVRLLVRRSGRLHEVTLVPELSCEAVWLTSEAGVSGGGRRAEIRTRARMLREREQEAHTRALHRTGPGFLGLALRCTECVLVLSARSGTAEFRFDDYPEVAEVVVGSPAQRAGLVSGDVLTHLDGADLRRASAARLLADLVLGNAEDEVTIRYRRDGETMQAVIRLRR